jgi:hypothetical protein
MLLYDEKILYEKKIIRLRLAPRIGMNKLKNLLPNAPVHGIPFNYSIPVVNTQEFGSKAPELTYTDPSGMVVNELSCRNDEPRIGIVIEDRPWSFDEDGDLVRVLSEARRIHLALLFNSMRVVHTSVVKPLPYRIISVFDTASPRSRTDDN